ncbi:nucleotidyltransferase family protein [Burkholderia pseudomallei]|uniref:nucleotidyltransferase family protein n=1 Tax=Burkholderia pseudomallei TaxID=28450 RepID=UPI0004648EDB|nr:nucleotidyltransferase family protein [Burkholderia pseudomallei]AIP60498.1 nucleotidyl transferase family protein [Burkholderia pseudomallei HBPUB10303a]CAJ6697173.1 D-glycero-D-manno-heptose 1-phosphate guanosyltransferase [Burkholderia pseudomallei]CAJ7204531.1 D-glycero-D-manno-heptose 1-phosphate guanosyltransferase [Burkholderia pseudomallei]CAJ9929476.1 D-glycero-D-manno-heptose 1-phosphate guanosyltransferase [Burkholderia pseudomallei]VBL00303.1 D-glycero-D-manno-heptose 1-phosphat
MREAIILAGGFGTRLRTVVSDVPKPMAPIAGRPFLEILLTRLSEKKFSRVVLSVGFMAEKIMSHFGDRFAGIDLAYSVESDPLGTGGALKATLPYCEGDHAFVFNGDTYLDLEVDELDDGWQTGGFPTIVARQVPDTGRYGRLVVDGGRVTGFAEKGVSGPGLINAGCYVLPKDILAGETAEAFSFETDFMSSAVQSRRFDVFVTRGQFIDIGVPEDFYRAQDELSGSCK